MLIPKAEIDKKSAPLQQDDSQDSSEQMELKERLRRTLYYGRMPSLERPSLAMTELAVDVLRDVAPRDLGKIDMYWASEVSRDTMLSPVPLTVGLMYAKRLKKKNSSFVHRISSSDLFLVSMMMASKFLHDEGEEDCVVNEEWATSAHMDVDELNQLERNFLTALDWELYVSADEFWDSLKTIEKLVAYRKSRERGSFTYTDLCVLTDGAVTDLLCHMLLEVCKVAAVCVVAYVAGVTVLAGATAVIHTASVTVGSMVPAHGDPVLDNQSACSDVLLADKVVKQVTEVRGRQSTAPVTRPQSFLISLFHIFSVTKTVASSELFQVDHSSTISDSVCTRNRSTSVQYFLGEGHVPPPCSNNKTSVERPSTDVCRRQQLPAAKKTKYCRRGMPADHVPLIPRSCHRVLPAYRDPVILHQLSSSHPATESGTSPSPESPAAISSSSPLSDTYNSSLLIQLTTHVQLV